MTRCYVAVDLGAETGRVIVGSLARESIALTEVYRFANIPVRVAHGLHWDVLRIFSDVLHGIERALAVDGGPIVSVGVDSWGVDYGVLDSGGRLIGNPYHYRDSRTDGMDAVYARRVCERAQYERTGIAQLPINTLYQLSAQARDDTLLAHAESLLLIPDLMHFWLSGERSMEWTNASTTGALAVDGQWADELIAACGVSRRLFREPVAAGTDLGCLRDTVPMHDAAANIRVVVPATHDTASAVLAAPLHRVPSPQTCAFISSGTWSLLGLELDAPVLSESARLAGFTNERGVGGKTHFLRNIMGLWLVQECRRAWRRAGVDWTYEELTARAAASGTPNVIIDVTDNTLLHPADMPAALADGLRRTGQRVEPDPIALTRAIFEGLALQYRHSIADAQRLSGRRVGAIAIVGGGSRNALLCQLTADACACVVYAGPAEASATGNILMQAVADRALGGVREVHAFMASTGAAHVFEPRSTGAIDWNARDAMLTQLREGGGGLRMPRDRTERIGYV